MSSLPPNPADDRVNFLLGEISHLEKELVRENLRKEEEFHYKFHREKVRFMDEAKMRHRKLRLRLHRYLLRSRWLVLLTAPVIWVCLIPLLLVDLAVSFYQAICFPIYGIPKVRRHDYLAFDRHHLGYLNAIEKVNCEYCSYANGILAYFTEVAARTEQYWCPIKHAHGAKSAHSRYRKFVDYGDGEKYRQNLDEVRRAFQDIDPGPPKG